MIDKLIKLFKKNNEIELQKQYEVLVNKYPGLLLKNLNLVDKKELLDKVIETENIKYFHFLKNNDFSFNFKGAPGLFEELMKTSFSCKYWEEINSELIKNNNIKSLANRNPNIAQHLLHYLEFAKVEWLIDKGFPKKEIDANNAINAAVRNLNAKEIENILKLDIDKNTSSPNVKQIFSSNLYYLSDNRKTYLQKSKFALRFSDCLDVLERYNLMDQALKNEVCITLSCISDTPFEFLNELFVKYKPDLSNVDMSLIDMFFEPKDYLCYEKGKVYELLKKHKFDFNSIGHENVIAQAIENGDLKLLENFLSEFNNRRINLDLIETAFSYNQVAMGLYLVNKKAKKTSAIKVNVKDFLNYNKTLTDNNFKDEKEINKVLKIIDKYFPDFLDSVVDFTYNKNTKKIKDKINFAGMAFLYNEDLFTKYLNKKVCSNNDRNKVISLMFVDLYPYVIKEKGFDYFLEKVTNAKTITLEDKISASNYMFKIGLGRVFGGANKENKVETMLNGFKALKEKIEIEKILSPRPIENKSKRRI